MTTRNTIRLALPSKGRLAEQTFNFLDKCGLKVYRPNSRQYIASMPSQPSVEVILQRPGDIATGLQQDSLDLGITGLDMLNEKNHEAENQPLVLHEALGYGHCTLNLAAPNKLGIATLDDLRAMAHALAADGKQLRVATKFPKLTAAFLTDHSITPFKLIDAEGTLEIAPVIGFADVIVDLVSSGLTLRDNHLSKIPGGQLLSSQSVLAANRHALKTRPDVLAVAQTFLEFIEAYQRARDSLMIVGNMRGNSAEEVAQRMFQHPALQGLRGPTIAPIFTQNSDGHNWFSISIAVQKHQLQSTIAALRVSGGSGVIVTPALFIFEEEPKRARAMLDALNMS